MSKMCHDIHQLFASMTRYDVSEIDKSEIPENGIYILFEKGEMVHGTDRIVRVGTHRGDGNLISRLKEHFLRENKDRSIFRKNIGRAILNKRNDPFLEQWNWCLTTKENRQKYSKRLEIEKQKRMEMEVSKYIRENFMFALLEVPTKEERLELESKIISTVSWCDECGPSQMWLGNFSPVEKISQSGLWLVQGLNKTALDDDDYRKIENNIKTDKLCS